MAVPPVQAPLQGACALAISTDDDNDYGDANAKATVQAADNDKLRHAHTSRRLYKQQTCLALGRLGLT